MCAQLAIGRFCRPTAGRRYTESLQLQEGQVVGGRFEVVRHVVDGGMGRVYRGRDLTGGGDVAIKIIAAASSGGIARFERESEILSGLDHPGLVRFIAKGLTETQQPYLVSEWIEGSTLRSRLATTGLTVTETVAVVRSLAAALEVAHQGGVIHRDIKPSNVMLEEDDVTKVRLLDFGIARLVAGDSQLTRTGTAVGTPGYMAPEQARGQTDLDERVDVFALGCMLYRGVTGISPFDGTDMAAARAKVIIHEPMGLHEVRSIVSSELSAACAKMLAKERDDRAADCAEVEALLAPIDLSFDDGEHVLDRRVAETTVSPPTLTDRQGSRSSVALLRDLGQTSGQVDDALTATLSRALTPLRGSFSVIDSGTAVFRADHIDPIEAASRAAKAAVVMAMLVPSAGIGVASGPAAALPATLDVASREAEACAMRRLFQRGVVGVAHLDSATATLLENRFDIEHDGGANVLKPPEVG